MPESKEKLRPTPNQIKAARMLLEMSQQELAAAANVSHTTIEMFESKKTRPRAETMERIVDALRARGIEFTNGRNPGVRLMQDQADRL